MPLKPYSVPTPAPTSASASTLPPQPLPLPQPHLTVSTSASNDASIRSDQVEAALRSKPQRGRKRENLSFLERLELTRTRNREHAKSTRIRKKARYQELVTFEAKYNNLKAMFELDDKRRDCLLRFLSLRSECMQRGTTLVQGETTPQPPPLSGCLATATKPPSQPQPQTLKRESEAHIGHPESDHSNGDVECVSAVHSNGTNNHHLNHSEHPTNTATAVRLDEVLHSVSRFKFCVPRIPGSPPASLKTDPIHSLKDGSLCENGGIEALVKYDSLTRLCIEGYYGGESVASTVRWVVVGNANGDPHTHAHSYAHMHHGPQDPQSSERKAIAVSEENTAYAKYNLVVTDHTQPNQPVERVISNGVLSVGFEEDSVKITSLEIWSSKKWIPANANGMVNGISQTSASTSLHSHKSLSAVPAIGSGSHGTNNSSSSSSSTQAEKKDAELRAISSFPSVISLETNSAEVTGIPNPITGGMVGAPTAPPIPPPETTTLLQQPQPQPQPPPIEKHVKVEDISTNCTENTPRITKHDPLFMDDRGYDHCEL